MRVSASSLLPSAREQDALLKHKFHVRDVMSRELTSAPPSMSLREAGQLLLDKRIGCLPVVDEHNKLLGIVTQHDLVKLALTLLPGD